MNAILIIVGIIVGVGVGLVISHTILKKTLSKKGEAILQDAENTLKKAKKIPQRQLFLV